MRNVNSHNNNNSGSLAIVVIPQKKGLNFKVKFNRKFYKIILISLVIMACLLLIKPSYMVAKSVLAQVLLNHAWSEAQQQNNDQKRLPWQWADSYPVAKLTYIKKSGTSGAFGDSTGDFTRNSTSVVTEVNKEEESWIILAGMNGRAMAFAPTWLEDSAKPNQYGNTVISAHNDSHFNALENIELGDDFLLEDQQGAILNYNVMTIDVVNKHDISPYLFQDETMITLITCYPFEATNTPKAQRLVIQAVKVDNTNPTI